VEVALLVVEEVLVVPVPPVVEEDNNCDVYKCIFKRSSI
jgi:hypothetical protein